MENEMGLIFFSFQISDMSDGIDKDPRMEIDRDRGAGKKKTR